MYSLPIVDLENVADRVRDFWPSNKVFVLTGATGFFGRWIVESIALLEEKLSAQNQFILISRQNADVLRTNIGILKSPVFTLIKQDLAESFQINQTANFLIHAASDVVQSKSPEGNDFSAIVNGTKNILEACKVTEKILYVSSGAVYSDSSSGFNENSSLIIAGNIDTYGKAKLHSEQLIGFKKNYCIARCFSFVGPFAAEKMAAMSMLAKKVSMESIVVNSPEVIRSYMYPSDLVVSLFKLLLLRNESQIYNIGSNIPITLGNLAKKISLLEPVSTIEIKGIDGQTSLAGSCYYPNTDRFDTEFGKSVSTNLDSALIKTYNFLSSRRSA